MKNDIKFFNPNEIDDETAEKMALNAEKRFQEFRDKLESGNLTPEEKESIELTDKFLEEGIEALTD